MTDPRKERLDSWKEIADYLNKAVRTVIRYERERAMPVHRVPGGHGPGSVYAYSQELDAWLAGNPDASGSPGDLGIGSVLRRRLLWGVGCTLAAVLGLAAFVVTRPGRPAEVRIVGRYLVAKDERGRLAWRFELPQGAGDATDLEFSRPIRVVDVDGDGRPEVLATLRYCLEPTCRGYEHELLCFAGDGTLLWRYKPAFTMESVQGRYEGGWHFTELVVSPAEGIGRTPRVIWVAAAHRDLWPSFVARITADGQSSIRFISSGVVYHLASFREKSGSYVLAGGVDNDYNAAFLAVLGEDQHAAVGPHDASSRYACVNCPTGHPLRYLLLPRTEMNVFYAGAPYNMVDQLEVLGNEISVRTLEGSVGEQGRQGIAQGMYIFSRDLQAKSVDVSSGYVQLHARAEREGDVNHSFWRCPERQSPKPIREWTPEGWREVPVPWHSVVGGAP